MRIRCHIARLRPDLAVPVQFSLNGRELAEIFRDGSMGMVGSGIELTVDRSRLDSIALASGRRTSTLVLHEMLATLTQTPLHTIGPTDQIGVILADEHESAGQPNLPTIFGEMFDPGFFPREMAEMGEARAMIFEHHPRQGCAVFLNTIARGIDPARLDEAVMLNIVHELGHVFNLWHLPQSVTAKSFMNANVLGEDRRFLIARNQYRFLNSIASPMNQQMFLSKCGESDFVTPGGQPFGSRGGLGPEEFSNKAVRSAAAKRKRRPAGSLRLRINLSQDEFDFFEPVELYVRVSLPRSARKAVRISNRLDPGFDEFQIFIEQPNGERRKYRAVKFPCGPHTYRNLRPGETYERDIGIFGQSAGFTFSGPGEYRIQAFFEASRSRQLVSNVVRAYVRPSRKGARDYQRALQHFCHPLCAWAAFYRDAPATQQAVRRLMDAEADVAKLASGAQFSYGVGRTFARIAAGRLRGRKKILQAALRLLQNSADDDRLGAHARHRAEETYHQLRNS